MLPSEIHPTMSTDPYVRFFARMDEIHQFDMDAEQPTCWKCREPVPCDTMRALWVYASETRPGGLV